MKDNFFQLDEVGKEFFEGQWLCFQEVHDDYLFLNIQKYNVKIILLVNLYMM